MPNTQLTVIDFGPAKIIFEDRGLVDGRHSKVTNEFYTDEGVIKDGRFFANGKDQGEPLADVEFGRIPVAPSAISSTASAAANARTSTPKSSKGIAPHCFATSATSPINSARRWRFDEAVQPTLAATRPWPGRSIATQRHLADTAKLNLATASYRLGRRLAFDAAAERFVGDEEANRWLAGPCRPGYIVP